MNVTLKDMLDGSEPVALVGQGGGMRGTYSIAALAAFEAAGYTKRFADVYGTSAGALNCAYFLSGQAAEGIAIYVDHLSNRRFINPLRVRPVIDIDYLIDDVLQKRVPLDVAALEASPATLHVGLASAQRGTVVWALPGRPEWPLFETLRATAALPVVFGREIAIGTDRYVDGGLHAPVPLVKAIADGYRNIVVILTRSLDFQPELPGPFTASAIRLMARLRGHSREVIQQLGGQSEQLRIALDIIKGDATDAPDLRIWAVAPTGRIAGRLTNDRDVLRSTAELGQADVRRALECGPTSCQSAPA
jgi:predicted patatin/cPLA2 family phospholipase